MCLIQTISEIQQVAAVLRNLAACFGLEVERLTEKLFEVRVV